MARDSVDASAAITAEESQKCIAEGTDCNASPKPSGLPLSRKLCYAVGGAPYQMTVNTKGFFLQIFLLDVVQMGAFPTSLILFLGRAWDAISDPLVGYVVSKSRKTRIGKLIPCMTRGLNLVLDLWKYVHPTYDSFCVEMDECEDGIIPLTFRIVFSTPLGIVCYVMLWYTPQKTMSPTFSFSWYFTMCCLFDTFMSCYHVPYSSLNMFLGGSQKDRDSATGYRMGVEVLSALAGAGIQGQIVGVYHAKRAHACSQLNHSQAAQHNISSGTSDTLQETRRAYVIAAVIMGMLYLLCCMVLFLGVKEQLAPLSTLDQLRMPYLTCLKMVVNHTPYTWLIFGFLFSSLAFQMAQGNFALFNTHVAGLGGYFQHLVLILLSASTLSIPVWQMLLLRLGKKTTIFIGLSIYIPTLIIIASVKTHLPTYILMSILAGSSLAALYLLPWSMLPDVVDDFKVKHPTCKDLEPMFYSCFVFFNKFGGGVSVGISTLALHFVGYEPGACKHNDRVISTLRVLFAPVPIVLLLVGMLLFYFYPINEERRQQIQRELEEAVKVNANFDRISIEATPDPSKSSPN